MRIRSRLGRAAFLSLAFFVVIEYSTRHIFITYMSQDKLIILKNKESGDVYFSRKNRKTVEKKIELKKYSSSLRKHVAFKEAKK